MVCEEVPQPPSAVEELLALLRGSNRFHLQDTEADVVVKALPEVVVQTGDTGIPTAFPFPAYGSLPIVSGRRYGRLSPTVGLQTSVHIHRVHALSCPTHLNALRVQARIRVPVLLLRLIMDVAHI